MPLQLLARGPNVIQLLTRGTPGLDGVDGEDGRDGLDGISMFGAEERPGDVRMLFTSSLAGAGRDLLPIEQGVVVNTQDGAVLRVSATNNASSVVVASRIDRGVEAGVVYAARFAVRRSTNPADPLNDAVQLGIAWLDGSKVKIGETLVYDDGLTPFEGLLVRTATFSRTLAADITAPSAARYARPFVRVFGYDGKLDISVVKTVESTGLPGAKGDDGDLTPAATAAKDAAVAAASEAQGYAAALSPVADRVALKAASVASKKTTITYAEGQRNGVWSWDGTNRSSTLCPGTITATAADAATDTITAAAHGLKNGDAVFLATAAAGLSANTIYFVIAATADAFKLAASYGGSAIDLSASSGFSLRSHIDPSEAIFLVPGGKAFDGSEGVWVRRDGWAVYGLNPAWCGVVGDYATDDAAALQAALNLGMALCCPVVLPRGNFKISAGLAIDRPLKLRGVGMQGDHGAVYYAAYNEQTTGWETSVIKPTGSFTALTISATWFSVSDFQIDFTGIGTPATGAIGVRAVTPTQKRKRGAYSRLTDVCVNRGYYGFDIADQFDFRMTGCLSIDNEGWGLLLRHSINADYPIPNNPSHSDSSIDGNSLINNQSGGILIQNGGGYRIVNNKINYGNSTSIGILVAPTLALTPAAQIEPLIIANNSIEGQNQGIVFSRNAGNYVISEVAITGNQIWIGASCIAFVGDASWINGVLIGSNFFCNAIDGSTMIQLAQCQNVNLTGNEFTTAAASATLLSIGANVGRFKMSGNDWSQAITGPAASVPAVAASGATMTNTNPFAVEVALYGGTGTQVFINGTPVLGQSAGEIRFCGTLNPRDTISITYTITPSMTWRPINR